MGKKIIIGIGCLVGVAALSAPKDNTEEKPVEQAQMTTVAQVTTAVENNVPDRNITLNDENSVADTFITAEETVIGNIEEILQESEALLELEETIPIETTEEIIVATEELTTIDQTSVAPTTTVMPTVVEEIVTTVFSNEYYYVLNTNTKKFHYPSCSSVKQMKDKNRSDVYMSREEIISQGYSSCGNCHP